MNPSILLSARMAGASGQSWSDWQCSDEVQAWVDTPDGINGRKDIRACETAYREGVREHRIGEGWRVAWTTAPEGYDTFGTETIPAADGAMGMGDWYGKTLRRVMMDPRHASYQADRYSSGLHSTWDEDPRIEEAASKARIERDRVEREERAEKRAKGLVWLKTLDATDLAACAEFDDAHAHASAQGLTTADVRTEQARRQIAADDVKRADDWTRCLALVPEGSTILDPGTPGFRGTYGWIQGRPTHVYYNVRIVHAWPDDVEHANVIGEGVNDYKGSCNAGSLDDVADMIARGAKGDAAVDAEGFHQRVMRIVPADSIPPRPVVERIGHAAPTRAFGAWRRPGASCG